MARPNPHQRLIKGGGGRDQTRRIPTSLCSARKAASAKPRGNQPSSDQIKHNNNNKTKIMAGGSSLEAVKKKIKSLQEQADVAEERAALLQRELNQERSAREAVSC